MCGHYIQSIQVTCKINHDIINHRWLAVFPVSLPSTSLPFFRSNSKQYVVRQHVVSRLVQFSALDSVLT